MDLCSTDDYITHKVAKERGFHGEDVQLVVEGMGGKETFYDTKLYTVPIYDKYGVMQFLVWPLLWKLDRTKTFVGSLVLNPMR